MRLKTFMLLEHLSPLQFCKCGSKGTTMYQVCGLIIFSVKIILNQQYTSSEKQLTHSREAGMHKGVNKSYLEDRLESDLSNSSTSGCWCHRITQQLSPNPRSEILSRLIWRTEKLYHNPCKSTLETFAQHNFAAGISISHFCWDIRFTETKACCIYEEKHDKKEILRRFKSSNICLAQLWFIIWWSEFCDNRALWTPTRQNFHTKMFLMRSLNIAVEGLRPQNKKPITALRWPFFIVTQLNPSLFKSSLIHMNSELSWLQIIQVVTGIISIWIYD